MGLPDIHLKDIGKETGGATPEQAVSAVLSAVTRAATGSVGESVKSAGKGVTETASKAVESVKGATDAASKTVESVKGLFK